MADPERLDAALAALFLPAAPSPDDFYLCWTALSEGDRAYRLPPGRSGRVAELVQYGLTRDDLEYAVYVSMDRDEVPAGRKFAYALGVLKRSARTRRLQQLGLIPVEATPDVATLGPFIRTPSKHVHAPECRTLERANPRNAREVPSLVPFKPCSVCL